MYRAQAQRTSQSRQRCLYCGREYPPGHECWTCRILVPPAEGASLRPNGCARCPNPWLEAVELGPNDAIAFECRGCHSAFLNAGSWTALFDGVLAGEPVKLDRFQVRSGGGASPSPPMNLFPLVRCPVCRYEMERARFGANTALVIDVCNAHGVWLDPAELAQLIEIIRNGGDATTRFTQQAVHDPMEQFLLQELRNAEFAYDASVAQSSPYDSEARHSLSGVYLGAINSARLALDNYRLRKLNSR